ncbi:hypothetical protein BMS3Bbin14_02162 [bacterium BMS3Bbin14]|nr:hypothetical protein BMS3Bbin14_02162 [bacterium BMS3Bbin14]
MQIASRRDLRGGNLGGILSPYEFTSALNSFAWDSESILSGCEEAKTDEDEVLVDSYQ